MLDALVPLPRHVEIGACLSYSSPDSLPVGCLVRVPLGRRTVTGLVWASRRTVSTPYMENPGAGDAPAAADANDVANAGGIPACDEAAAPSAEMALRPIAAAA